MDNFNKAANSSNFFSKFRFITRHHKSFLPSSTERLCNHCDLIKREGTNGQLILLNRSYTIFRPIAEKFIHHTRQVDQSTVVF